MTELGLTFYTNSFLGIFHVIIIVNVCFFSHAKIVYLFYAGKRCDYVCKNETT